MLQSIGYQGQINCFDLGLEAVEFLHSVHSPEGELQAADMVFYSFQLQVSNQLINLQKLTKPELI
jgi:hypothetical protein